MAPVSDRIKKCDYLARINSNAHFTFFLHQFPTSDLSDGRVQQEGAGAMRPRVRSKTILTNPFTTLVLAAPARHAASFSD